MSISTYLRCKSTKKAVHVSEQSSRWLRGADYPLAVALFCLAHSGLELETIDGDHFDDQIYYDIWTLDNMKSEYESLTGRAFPLI